jgi:flagellar basal body-associated protein FliL
MDSKVATPKKGIKGLLVWIVLAIMSASAGASLPWIMRGKHHDNAAAKKNEPPKHKTAAIPFGEVVVNLGEERLNRYLRVKLLVAVEESDAKEMTELLTKQKAFLKDWLIGYLFSHSSQDVGRKLVVSRIRREIRDQFNAMLYPGGEEKILEILFDEFVVQ